MKLYNAVSGMNPVQNFVAAAGCTVNAGDFVKLSGGYLVPCANADSTCIGRALAGGTQLATIPTITQADGTTVVDFSQQGYGGLVVIPVAVAFETVSYDIPVTDATTGSTPVDVPFDLTFKGGQFGLKLASGVYTLNAGDTTHKLLVVRDVLQTGANNTGIARVVVVRSAFGL